MAQDLSQKVARLIGDFHAVLELINFIDHELEKRIVARLGLIKVEALASVAGAYKNQIKHSMTNGAARVAQVEALLAKLRNDVDGGIRDIRNAMAGHLLLLNMKEIQDHWLFMGHSTFTILGQDLAAIDAEFAQLPSYPKSGAAPKLDPQLKGFWAQPDRLGPPTAARIINMQVGLWTPEAVAPVPGGTSFQDASIRVLGLRLSIRQLGLLYLPFWALGGPISVYERVMLELAVVDFFALEEAMFDGNARGATLSLVDEWSTPARPHPGIDVLKQQRAHLSSARQGWKTNVRDKICAHMDASIPAADLEVDRWPMSLPDFHAEIERLCQMLGQAARADMRTRYFTMAAVPILNGTVPKRTDVPRWADT